MFVRMEKQSRAAEFKSTSVEIIANLLIREKPIIGSHFFPLKDIIALVC